MRCHTVGHSNKNYAGVGIGAGRGHGRGGHFWSFSSHGAGKPFHVKPPVEFQKPGIVWKVKRHLYGDKRAEQQC